MKRLRLAVCLILLSCARTVAHAAGEDPFSFLALDVDARAAAMGGAYVTRATNSNALHYNPAGLGFVKRSETTLMHNQFVQGITQEYLSFVGRDGVGAQLNVVRVTNLSRTTYGRPDGSLGRFEVNDVSAGLGYGRVFGEGLGAGIAGKYLGESQPGASASSFAADTGVLWAPPTSGLRLGVAAQNLGPQVRFISGHEKLPIKVRVGASYSLSRLVLSADVMRERSGPTRFAAGLEAGVTKDLALRAGFNSRNETDIGISGGFGWSWKSGSIDYTFQPYGALGLAHRISITLRGSIEGREPRQGPLTLSDELVPWPDAPELELMDDAAVNENISAARRLLIADRAAAAQRTLFEVLRRTRRDDPRKLGVHFLLGDTFFRQGACANAEQQYQEGMRRAAAKNLTPAQLAPSYQNLGRCYEAQGLLAKALDHYYSAVRLAPSEELRKRIEMIEVGLSGSR